MSNNNLCWAVGHRTRPDHSKTAIVPSSPSSLPHHLVRRSPRTCVAESRQSPDETTCTLHAQAMSRTSYYDGESHEKRISKHRVSDDELFECVLPSPPHLRLLNLRFKLCAPGSVSPPDDLGFEPRNGLISPNAFSFRLRLRFRSRPPQIPRLSHPTENSRRSL